MPKNSLTVLIPKHKNTKISNLPPDMQVLFGFLTLIVDIEYRNRYGSYLPDRAAAARMEGQK
jgi:hypothetical protein